MERKDINQQISIAYIEAIGSSEKVEMETAYTFLIYIELGIIKAAYPSIKKAHSQAINLLNYLNESENVKYRMDQEDNHDNIKLWFENNKDALLEIIEDIWNTEIYDNELKWLESWIVYYRQFFKDLDFIQSFIYLNKLINEQIGFGDKNLPPILLLNLFIQLSKSLLNGNKIIRIA